MVRTIKLLSLLALLFVPANRVAGAKQLHVGMSPWIADYPLNVADVKGFFKLEGIDIKVTNFASDQEMQAAAKHKRVDFIADMLGSFVGYDQEGFPMTILAQTDWSHGGDQIILKKGVEIKSLKGQPLGVYQNKPSVTYFLDKWLGTKGLHLKDFKLVDMEAENVTKNFIAGKMKLIVNYDPYSGDAVKKGNGVVMATTATWPGVMPEGIGGHADMVSKIPAKDLTGFFKAWVRAVEWAQNPKNWPEFAKILRTKTFPGETLSDQDLKDMLASVHIHKKAELKTFNQPGGASDKFLSSVAAFLKTNGLLKKPVAPKSLFFPAAVLKAVN